MHGIYLYPEQTPSRARVEPLQGRRNVMTPGAIAVPVPVSCEPFPRHTGHRDGSLLSDLTWALPVDAIEVGPGYRVGQACRPDVRVSDQRGRHDRVSQQFRSIGVERPKGPGPHRGSQGISRFSADSVDTRAPFCFLPGCPQAFSGRSIYRSL